MVTLGHEPSSEGTSQRQDCEAGISETEDLVVSRTNLTSSESGSSDQGAMTSVTNSPAIETSGEKVAYETDEIETNAAEPDGNMKSKANRKKIKPQARNGASSTVTAVTPPVEFFTCEFCDKKFLKKRYLKQHLQYHFPKLVTCSLCQEQVLERKLDEHKSNFHVEATCPICSMVLPSQVLLRKHIRCKHSRVKQGTKKGRRLRYLW